MTSKPGRIVDFDELCNELRPLEYLYAANSGRDFTYFKTDDVIDLLCRLAKPATPEPTRASQASRDLIDRKAALDIVVNTSSAAEAWQKINSLPAVSVGEQEYPFYVLDKDLQPMKQPKEPSIAQMIDDALGINGGGLNDIYGLADILRRIVKEIEGLK